ncbi:F-box only protein 5 [Diretmus argenteus]
MAQPKSLHNIKKLILEQPNFLHNIKKQILEQPNSLHNIKKQILEQPNSLHNIKKQILEQPKSLHNIKKQILEQPKSLHNIKKLILEQPKSLHNIKKQILEQPKSLHNIKKLILEQPKSLHNIKKQILEQPKSLHNIKKQILEQPKSLHNIKKQILEQPKSLHNIKKLILEQPKSLHNIKKQFAFRWTFVSHPEEVTMKCPSYEATRGSKLEKSSTTAPLVSAESKVSHPKASPLKDCSTIIPQLSPAGMTAAMFSLDGSDTKTVHNKENNNNNNREHDRTLDEAFEDSGYLSLRNSQIHEHHEAEEDGSHIQGCPPVPPQERNITPRHSPSKCPTSLVTASTPTVSPGRKVSALTSTPTSHRGDHGLPNLPILRFQQAVCAELAKSYQKNKRYDWSVVAKLAEDHVLDRVIGRQMGLEYVDVFSSLLSRNMRGILTRVLALLGDMDLISCRKVSRTWRKIISEDTVAVSRCQQAEQALMESRNYLGQTKGSGLTRDVALSRVVLSCMQTLASSRPSPSSSSSSHRANIQAPPSQKDHNPNSPHTRFQQYLEAASRLKQHESLRPCKRCGSPATHLAEAQRATCMRPSCLFDFCTCCREAFHGSSPCRTVLPRPHHPSSKATRGPAGSARSKRNLRRL